jgi:hypothetical protein
LKSGNLDEIAKVLEAKRSQARTDKEAKIFEEALSYTRMTQTVSEKGTTTSDALTKAFTKAKEEAQRLTFSDKESAIYAQELAQKYGLELTPQALEKLIAAVQSGDTKQIMAVLGDIASKSELRVGKDAQDLLNQKKEVEQSGVEIKEQVKHKTDSVEQKMENVSKELKKDEKNVQPKLNEADKNLHDVDPGKIPQPTPPSSEMPKKPEKKEEVKQQPPQQPPVQNQQDQPPVDPKKLKEYLDIEGRPIKGQPSAGKVFKQAANRSSHGQMKNPFTRIDQQVPKKGTPEAPGVDSVNSRSGGGSKNVSRQESGTWTEL